MVSAITVIAIQMQVLIRSKGACAFLWATCWRLAHVIAAGTGTVTYAQLAACGSIAVEEQNDCRSEAHAAYVIEVMLSSIPKQPIIIIIIAAADHL